MGKIIADLIDVMVNLLYPTTFYSFIQIMKSFSLMKFKNIIFLAFFLNPLLLFAQREVDNWFFGRKIGLSFSNGHPVPIYGSSINQVEGTAVASDSKSGKLLFYSDGITVWNAEHQIMGNGEGLLGSGTSTQSALIMPLPGINHRYYLFTTRSFSDNSGGLNYSIIDMNLSNGLGDVVKGIKNIPLEKQGSEKLTAIPHSNKRDFWLISHRWNSDVFLIYLVSPLGISSVNEIKVGTVHQKAIADNQIGEEMGALKGSPDGRFLAAAVYGYNRPFELYNFDNKTGRISNYRSLGNFTSQYGLSFSPDNSKLYMSGLSDEGAFQFDLKKPEANPFPLSISGSTGSNPSYISGSMQLGPDGKLYIASIERTNLLVINSPDSSGENIDIRELDFDFKDGKILEGLPNFSQSTFNTSPILPHVPEDTNCGDDLNVFPNPVVSQKLTIQMDSAGWRNNCKLLKFKVYLLSGVEILSNESGINDTFEIDVHLWAPGLYILVFEYGKTRIVKKIVKI